MTRLASRQATAGPSGTWGDTGRPEAEPGALQEQTQALAQTPCCCRDTGSISFNGEKERGLDTMTNTL